MTAVAVTALFASAACGSSTSVSTAAPNATPATDRTSGEATDDSVAAEVPSDDTPPDDATSADPALPESPKDATGDDAMTDDPADPSLSAPPSDGMIGTANLNGETVDPRPHIIDSFAVAESYPEQIALTFTAGDPNCLAADAIATADGDQVVVALRVGITTDAMTRSCQAALFEHRMMIALTEGLDGREVVLETVDIVDDTAKEPPAQDFASTLIGMNATSAQEGAESFGYRWRVMALDGEAFMGTTDFDENRVNVAIENDVVVDAWLG